MTNTSVSTEQQKEIEEIYEPKDFSLQIFKDRYAFTESETWQESCKRVSRTVASVESNGKKEDWEQKFFKELASNRFIPGGRVWYGAQRVKSNMVNCFVLSVSDSREGWGQCCSDCIVISGVGGGVGIDYSTIRPRGAPIRGTGGEASGAVSFMQVINSIAEIIKSGGGRRSAHMQVLSINHPDIQEFLDAKLDKNKLNNANISVSFSSISPEDFFKLVDNNENLILKWKDQEFGKVKAKELWQKIIDNAYENGEPGLFNCSYANKMNNLYYYKPIVATNPCIVGSTLIAVADGRKAVSIKQLCEEEKDVLVYSIKISPSIKAIEIQTARNIRKTKEKAEVWKLILDSVRGESSIIATPEHKFYLRDGTKSELKNLKIGDNLLPFDINTDYLEDMITVKKLEFYGYEDVYNMTVDNNHNYCVVTSDKHYGICISNCGEIAGSPDASCVLGSLVLSRFVGEDRKINWDKLDYTIRVGVRFLDNVVSVTTYPLQRIEDEAKNTRRIGLGVTGLHDMLTLMGIKYSSEEAIKIVDKVFDFIKNRAYETSTYLSVEKGTFGVYDKEAVLKSGFIKTLKPSVRMRIKEYGLRNSNLLSCAPAGTISIVSGNTSSGIEPIFGPAWLRRYYDKKDSDKMKEEIVFHPLFIKFMQEGKDVSMFESSEDISLAFHFEIQKACQKHVDQSISKTILIDPKKISKKEFEKTIRQYLPELKGTTIYPVNSRENQPITPLSLQNAKKLWKEKNTENKINLQNSGSMSIDSCKSGLCEI